MGERGFFDLRKQFVFYASYHNQPVNVFIHLVCIWNLLWSGMCLMHFTPQLAASPDILNKVPLIGGTPINLTLLVTLIYVVTYIMMDPVAGSLAASLVLLLHRFTFDLATTNAPVQGYPLWQALLFNAFSLLMRTSPWRCALSESTSPPASPPPPAGSCPTLAPPSLRIQTSRAPKRRWTQGLQNIWASLFPRASPRTTWRRNKSQERPSSLARWSTSSRGILRSSTGTRSRNQNRFSTQRRR